MISLPYLLFIIGYAGWFTVIATPNLFNRKPYKRWVGVLVWFALVMINFPPSMVWPRMQAHIMEPGTLFLFVLSPYLVMGLIYRFWKRSRKPVAQ